ncbi:MAG: acetyl-CoA acetyltransferase [Anaerolineae bacterium UTCFX2]|jgi:acetyl-CoA C-acetyltransferase|nr:MAG: acetyl-CoA acetyltransferase [Anaerolineae bacterium UTCFX2]
MSVDFSENDPVILSAVRTAGGRFQGSLSGIAAPKLGALAIKAAVERAGIEKTAEIDEVFMGNVVSAGLGQAPARQAAIFGGLPVSVGATTVNKVCGSGLKAVILASQAVRAGDGDLFIAGGMENMSRVPYLVDGRTGALRFGHAQLTDALLNDGLWDPFVEWPMGDAAEFIAQEFDINRREMDEYAYHSHMKALAAIDEGRFVAEIVPVEISAKKGQTTVFAVDEGPRRETSLEALGNLRPAFQKDGRVTAGNAPGLNDGAAASVIASREKAVREGFQPIARILGYAQAALEPKWLFAAPAQAIPKVLQKLGLKLQDLDLIELNEAFAAQVLANGKELQDQGWDWSKVNVNGGAIALGHPIGASGARILATLIHALRDRGLNLGLACACLGGAEAVAVVVEIE